VAVGSVDDEPVALGSVEEFERVYGSSPQKSLGELQASFGDALRILPEPPRRAGWWTRLMWWGRS
jgi:hypothetical protein